MVGNIRWSWQEVCKGCTVAWNAVHVPCQSPELYWGQRMEFYLEHRDGESRKCASSWYVIVGVADVQEKDGLEASSASSRAPCFQQSKLSKLRQERLLRTHF